MHEVWHLSAEFYSEVPNFVYVKATKTNKYLDAF